MDYKNILWKSAQKKHEFACITIPKGDTKTRYQFQDYENLRATRLIGLCFQDHDAVPINVQTGNPTLDNSFVPSAFVTLQTYDGKQIFKQVPMYEFMLAGLAGLSNLTSLGLGEIAGQRISYPKSYIEFTAPITPAVDTDIVFSIFYFDIPEKEVEKLAVSFEKRS